MMSHGVVLTALLSAFAANGQDISAGGFHELRSILQEHAGGLRSSPEEGFVHEYLSGLTQAADDGTINYEPEDMPLDEEGMMSEEAKLVVDVDPAVVPPSPPVADDDPDAEAALRWLKGHEGHADDKNDTHEPNVTTTAAEPTMAETTTAEEEGVVEVTFTVNNIDYVKLVANTTALTNFIQVSKEALADHFGVAVTQVRVEIRQGSVIVDGIVIPPEGTTAAELLENHTGVDLATVAVQYIREADTAQRIGADVVTGEIAIDASSVRTDISPLWTTSVLDFTCRCRDGTAATGTSCTADNAEVCDQCNDGFALNADSVCEVSKVGVLTGASPCVFKFIGGGYCHPYGIQQEKELRIGSWVVGERRAAEKACCEDEACAGFHLDKDIPDYVLLRELDTFQETWPRRECWEKKIPDSAPLQALPLAAAAVAMLLHAAGA